MTVELITIGAELLSGHTLNTNALYVGDQLAKVGLTLARQIAIPDDHDVIVEAIRESLARADWVIVSGGLGPTNDDVTKKAIARVFDRPLIFHQDILDNLKARFARAKRPISALLDTQALQPRDAEFIPNAVGTALGIILSDKGRTLIAVPGVPREMQPMIADHIVPRIAEQARVTTQTITWSTAGWTESRLYETLEPLLEKHADVSVAFLPSALGVRVRFAASGADATRLLNPFTEEARILIGPAVYAEEDIGLEAVIGRLLTERQMTLALAESCTGGLIAKRLTDVPGASAYVVAGYVTYANEAKTDLLGVDPELIAAQGAVSEPVARAMADGALRRSGADCTIAVTGIAGPDGGTEEKPVGTVWLASAIKGRETETKEIHLLGNRQMIRLRASQAALNMLRLRLLNQTTGDW
ncbi:MAG TPA: competence/damage-inducible protein A [Acidobacteriota bacterium]|nr:competence/damage-inducible protein A [Acidobacteriota bacterium]